MNTPVKLSEARQLAADLFTAAARRDDLPTAGRLDCLAAEQSLATAGRPLPPLLDTLATDELITRAVRALAELTTDDFADSTVIDAARYGRRALRGRQ
jgi:hypothetical protein